MHICRCVCVYECVVYWCVCVCVCVCVCTALLVILRCLLVRVKYLQVWPPACLHQPQAPQRTVGNCMACITVAIFLKLGHVKLMEISFQFFVQFLCIFVYLHHSSSLAVLLREDVGGVYAQYTESIAVNLNKFLVDSMWPGLLSCMCFYDVLYEVKLPFWEKTCLL